MKKQEELKLLITEVQKFSEIKKAYVLKSILKRSPIVSQVDRVRMLKQLEIIRKDLNLTHEAFEMAIREMDKRESLDKVLRYSSAEKNETFPLDKKIHQSARKRFCLNKKCKNKFETNHVKSEYLTRCRVCGGRTVFLYSPEK